jgi:uncharacterized protein (DUF3084 family)
MAINTPQKFSPEELKQLKELQTKMDNIIIRFGQISINKQALESQEEQAKNSLSELKTQETEIAKSLSNKYGKGTLDIESGEFTPED